MFKAYNISKSFNQSEILCSATIEIEKGKITALCGKSGGGKSTLARIICGTIKPSSGTAFLNGAPLIYENGVYNKSLRPQVQLISQEPYSALDPKQTVINAIMEPMLYHGIAENKNIAEDMAVTLMEQVWLNKSILYRLPHQISGGQAQRVVIARALSVNPLLLISDESTSMLDLVSQGQIGDIYRNLTDKRGISVLFISHNQAIVNSLADKIYYIEDGKISIKLGENINEKE